MSIPGQEHMEGECLVVPQAACIDVEVGNARVHVPLGLEKPRWVVCSPMLDLNILVV